MFPLKNSFLLRNSQYDWPLGFQYSPGITAIHQHWSPLSSILSTALPNQLNQFRARNSSLGPCLSTTRLKQGSHEYKNTDNCQVPFNTRTLNVGINYFCNLRLEDFLFCWHFASPLVFLLQRMVPSGLLRGSWGWLWGLLGPTRTFRQIQDKLSVHSLLRGLQLSWDRVMASEKSRGLWST